MVQEHPERLDRENEIKRLRDDEFNRNRLREDAKKTKKVVGYRFNPHTTRPKKVGWGELCLVEFIPPLAKTLSTLIVRDIPTPDGIRMAGLVDEAAQAEHNKRKGKPNYGFPRFSQKR